MNKTKFKGNQNGIDKLSFTFNIHDNYKMTILDTVNSMVNGNKYNIRVFNDGNIRRRERYNNIYQFELDGFSVKVLAYPLNPKHNFLKVEFNPNKAKKEGLIIIRTLLIKLLTIETARCLYFEAPITRIDINVDIYTPGIMDFYPYMDGGNNSKVELNDEGEIQSKIVGSNSSSTRFTLYDKNAESGGKSNTEYYRLEARIRGKRCTMNQLNENLLLSEFNKVKFYHKGFLRNRNLSSDFKQAAGINGLNSALCTISKQYGSEMRKDYIKLLDKYLADPFDLANLDLSNIKQQLKPLKSKNYPI